jgi:hypothetical protein
MTKHYAMIKVEVRNFRRWFLGTQLQLLRYILTNAETHGESIQNELCWQGNTVVPIVF